MRLKKDKPWTTEDARVIKTDNGAPLNRAPKPVQFADSVALSYRQGAPEQVKDEEMDGDHTDNEAVVVEDEDKKDEGDVEMVF